jgi:hypothetical protein
VSLLAQNGEATVTGFRPGICRLLNPLIPHNQRERGFKIGGSSLQIHISMTTPTNTIAKPTNPSPLLHEPGPYRRFC